MKPAPDIVAAAPRCLSVRQPWASLIASGRKTLELRSKPTKYRGPLVIVASLTADAEHVARWTDGPRGVALCVVDLVGCRLADLRDRGAACYVPRAGHYVWILERPRALPPIPVKGQLSFYPPPPELLAALKEARR